MTNKIKVLAVDDDVFNLDILTEFLIDAGYDVIGADDGDTALKKLEEHLDVSIIILDRMMPRMNGLEAFKILKNDQRFCHIPVIMQTAAALSDQAVEAINAGVDKYISKPFECSELISLINEVLNNK